ncbi:MAG TPA: TolC family protein [Thermoanaerobaculia bacterium]|nr:TolC family protein [Thermoanaerobaculia bacterium]
MSFHRMALALVAGVLATDLSAAIDWQNERAVTAAAVANNPTMARVEQEVVAARERARAAGSLPNPMVMGGLQNKHVDLTDDKIMTMYMVGATQTFTRGSKREAARAVAALDVRAAELELDAVRAEIERDALLAWYDLAGVDTQLRAAETVRLLLDAVTAAARVRYEVGNAEQAEVIRAQLETIELDNRILSLRGTRENARARLLPLVGLPPETVIPRLVLEESTGALELGAPVEVPADHPALAAVEAEIAQREEEIRLARLLTRPDVSLEVSYGLRPTTKDMFSVVASLELPVRRSTLIEPRIREAVALRDAAQRRLEETRREIQRDLSVAAAAHEQANTQLALQNRVLLPQARLAFESTLASYQNGKSSFDSVLGAETTYLRLELEHIEHYIEHVKAITDFQALRRGARSGARP